MTLLKRGMEKASQVVVEEIKKMSQVVDSKEAIKQVALHFRS